MVARIYRLTDQGRKAWEGEDAAVPADYRRILWMMDLHGSATESLARVFPVDMLEEWLSELEELGMIELVPEGERALFLFGLVSIMAAFSVSAEMLILSRALLGIALASWQFFKRS